MRYSEFRLVETILLEYDRNKTAQKIGAKLLKAVELDIIFYRQIQGLELDEQINAVLEKLEEMDPTPNKQFVQWLAKQYIPKKNENNGQLRIEDAPRVKQILGYFIDRDVKRDFRRRGLPLDINQYDYYTLRREIVASAEGGIEQTPTPTVTASVDYENSDQMRILHASELGQLIIPLSEPASCELGAGTEWCTAWSERNRFETYNKDGPLYVWIDGQTGEKFQFHFESGQFMDSSDKKLNFEQMKYFREKNPITKQLFSTKEVQILKKNDPEVAYLYAQNSIHGRWPEAEPIIAEDPKSAHEYARDVINQGERKGIRWPEGEAAIAKDPEWAYAYARDVINQGERKGIRWPEGEAAIAKDPQLAYIYARDVINQGEYKGIRWREAEPAIAKHPQSAYEYARYVINQGEDKGIRWPEGEPTIAKGSYSAYAYAQHVIGGRFPEGEPAIARSWYKTVYERDFNVDLDKELRDK